MLKLNEKYEVRKNILKCDYLRYSPSEINTINTANSQKYVFISIYLQKVVLFLC